MEVGLHVQCSPREGGEDRVVKVADLREIAKCSLEACFRPNDGVDDSVHELVWHAAGFHQGEA